MFDSFTTEEFSLPSMQRATLSVVNVPKTPLNYSENTQIALADKSEFDLSQLPSFSGAVTLFC